MTDRPPRLDLFDDPPSPLVPDPGGSQFPFGHDETPSIRAALVMDRLFTDDPVGERARIAGAILRRSFPFAQDAEFAAAAPRAYRLGERIAEAIDGDAPGLGDPMAAVVENDPDAARAVDRTVWIAWANWLACGRHGNFARHWCVWVPKPHTENYVRLFVPWARPDFGSQFVRDEFEEAAERRAFEAERFFSRIRRALHRADLDGERAFAEMPTPDAVILLITATLFD